MSIGQPAGCNKGAVSGSEYRKTPPCLAATRVQSEAVSEHMHLQVAQTWRKGGSSCKGGQLPSAPSRARCPVDAGWTLWCRHLHFQTACQIGWSPMLPSCKMIRQLLRAVTPNNIGVWVNLYFAVLGLQTLVGVLLGLEGLVLMPTQVGFSFFCPQWHISARNFFWRDGLQIQVQSCAGLSRY